ncbi:MAG: hypothetical protein JWR22_3033 [Herminiimonas sp.]|nr:hypothetical protein [Herminiimonas sp.]
MKSNSSNPLRGSGAGPTGPVEPGKTPVAEKSAFSCSSSGPVAPLAATLVMATIPQAVVHPHAEIPINGTSSPRGQPVTGPNVPPPSPFSHATPSFLPGLAASTSLTSTSPGSVDANTSNAATHVLSCNPQVLANPRDKVADAPPPRPSSLPPDIPASVLPQLQVQGNTTAIVTGPHDQVAQDATSSTARPILHSKPSSSSSNGVKHFWSYKGEKAGGQHGAGAKGGIHLLVNKKSECIDLSGKKLNVLNDRDEAKDVDGQKITVIRNKAGDITRVSYDGAGKFDVTEHQKGQLCLADGRVIAKLDKAQLALLKFEPVIAKNMTEFLGSVIFRSRHPDLFPDVHLVDTSNGVNRKASDIYAASVYITDYKCDLYKDVYAQHGMPVPKEKPWYLGMTGTQWFIKNAFSKGQYQNFEKVTVPALRGDEFDMHTGNLGLKGDNQLVRIDLAGALRKICKHLELRPHSTSEHPLFKGPTNRFAQYDDSLKINASFVDELDKDVEHDYATPISAGFSDLVAFYDVEAFRALAEWVGIEANELPNSTDCKILSSFIAQKVTVAYAERGKDMSRYSAQIKADLCIEKKRGGGWLFKSYNDVDGNSVSFNDVVLKHQDYFADVLCGKEQFKLRAKDHSSDKALAQMTIDVVGATFAKNIVADPKLKGALDLLSKISGKKITTRDMANQALMKCSNDHRRQVLDVMVASQPAVSTPSNAQV